MLHRLEAGGFASRLEARLEEFPPEVASRPASHTGQVRFGSVRVQPGPTEGRRPDRDVLEVIAGRRGFLPPRNGQRPTTPPRRSLSWRSSRTCTASSASTTRKL